MMTAIGFAILVNMIWDNKIGIFLVFGFVLAKYLKLPALPIAIIVATIAMVYFLVMSNTISNKNETIKTKPNAKNEDEEEDFF